MDRVDTPESCQVPVNLVVFVRELDIIALDIGPPSIESLGWSPSVSALVLHISFFKRFARFLLLGGPFGFCFFDEFEDGVRAGGGDFDESVGAVEVGTVVGVFAG
jgi:hypothetical protein